MSELMHTTHVLAVLDLEKSRAWYTDQLGFEVMMEVDGWCFLNRGNVRLRLGHCPDAKPITECKDHSWFAYIHVQGIDDLYRDCCEREIEIWHPLDSKPWDMREFAIVTIDGHRIVFGESTR